jgi:hypothetical protein
MEELPSEFLVGTYLEVEEERFNGQQICLLYRAKIIRFLASFP